METYELEFQLGCTNIGQCFLEIFLIPFALAMLPIAIHIIQKHDIDRENNYV